MCFELMTEHFLAYLNEKGKELGYPFVMFSNGECGKGLVSSDGKHNAVLKVLRSFKDDAKIDGIKGEYGSVLPAKRLEVAEEPLSAEELKGFIKKIRDEERFSGNEQYRLVRFAPDNVVEDYLYKYSYQMFLFI